LVLPELSDFIESDFTAGALSDVVGDCANALPARATLNAVDNSIFLSIGVSSITYEFRDLNAWRRALFPCGETPTAVRKRNSGVRAFD
jgi:hypothetical protein